MENHIGLQVIQDPPTVMPTLSPGGGNATSHHEAIVSPTVVVVFVVVSISLAAFLAVFGIIMHLCKYRIMRQQQLDVQRLNLLPASDATLTTDPTDLHSTTAGVSDGNDNNDDNDDNYGSDDNEALVEERGHTHDSRSHHAVALEMI